jgi:hypothetical protein
VTGTSARAASPPLGAFGSGVAHRSPVFESEQGDRATAPAGRAGKADYPDLAFSSGAGTGGFGRMSHIPASPNNRSTITTA